MSTKKSAKKKRVRPQKIEVPSTEAASTEQVVFGLLSELISRGVEGGAYKWCLQKNADPARTVFVSCVPANMPDGVICSVMARTLNRGFVEIIDTVKSADSVYQSILVQAEGNLDGETCPTLIRCEDCPLGYWIMITPVKPLNSEMLPAIKDPKVANVFSPLMLEEECSNAEKQNRSSKDSPEKVAPAIRNDPPISMEQHKQKLKAGEGSALANMASAGEGSALANMASAGEGSAPANVASAGEGSATANVASVGEGSAPANVASAVERSAPENVASAGDGSVPANVASAGEGSVPANVASAGEGSAPANVPKVIVKESSLPEYGQLAGKEVSLPDENLPIPKEHSQQGKVQLPAMVLSKQAKVPSVADGSLQTKMPLLVSKDPSVTVNEPWSTEELLLSEKEAPKEQPVQLKLSSNVKVKTGQGSTGKEPLQSKVPLFDAKKSSTVNKPLLINPLTERVLPVTKKPLSASKLPSDLKELPPSTTVLPPAKVLPTALPASNEPKDLFSTIKLSPSPKPLQMINDNGRNCQTVPNDPERMENLLQNSFNPVVRDSSPNINLWAQEGIHPPVMNLPNADYNVLRKGNSMERQKRKEDIMKGLQFIQSTIPFHGSQDAYKHFLQELVENLFKEGNDLYREGEVKLALGQYTEGLTVADYAASEELVLSQELVCKLLVNRSCCYFSMGLYEKSLADSDKVLELDKENTRALYRKAKALDKLGKYHEAYSCISHRILILVQDESITELAQELVQKLGLKQRKAYKRPQQELETLGLLKNGVSASADSKISDEIGSVDDIYIDLPVDSKPLASSPGIKSQNNVLETATCNPSVTSTVALTASPGSDLTSDIIGDELDSFLDFDMASKHMPQLIPVFPTGNPLLSVLRPAVLQAPSPLPPASFGLMDGRKPPLVQAITPLRPVFGPQLKTLDSFGTVRETLDSLDTFANDSRPLEKWPLKGSTNLKNGGNFINHIITPKTEPLLIHPTAVSPAYHNNQLMQTYEFKQGCEKCYVKTGPKTLDFAHRERLEHKCNKDILLARMKNSENKQWLRIRPGPIKVNGPFMLCKDIQMRQSCKYGDNCTFAYYQEEIDVWNEERRGTFHRDQLFQPSGSVKSGNMARLLHEQKGIFIFLCQACFDSKPRIISKKNPENPEFCTNPTNQHIFNDNRCLVHVLNSSTVKYSKIRPLHLRFQMDVCRHEIRYGCIQEDTCNFAHSHIELKIWLLQKQSGVTQEEIVLESERMWKIPVPKPKSLPKPLDMKMKFVCGQCQGHGREIEADRDGKYCAAKARHSWIKERVLLVMSKSKKMWVPVRPLPSVRSFPQHYEICVHIQKGKKCQYIRQCTFAHSKEEKDVWTYMKESKVLDLQQVFDLCTKSNNPAEKPGLAGTGTAGSQKEAEKQILMPTDYADLMVGFHCYLCGKNSNSEKQWQQHIQSEKHKDRVFTLESEDSDWKYRFPAGEFKLCERYEETKICPNENNCPFAHGMGELTEWHERKGLLQLKVSKARKDKLLEPSDSDFGKYTFLMQDLPEGGVEKQSAGAL